MLSVCITQQLAAVGREFQFTTVGIATGEKKEEQVVVYCRAQSSKLRDEWLEALRAASRIAFERATTSGAAARSVTCLQPSGMSTPRKAAAQPPSSSRCQEKMCV